MQAYMKSNMPYHGVPAPLLRQVCNTLFADVHFEIASRRVGTILRSHPVPMQRRMLAWSRSKDLWKRRTAIICQLGFKAETDLQLLYACIEPLLGSREFFLQKAIGWALRQYAWTDGAEIKRYVRANRSRLSALSCREALKNL
jgi:3-methyladenine DNA glycosylase AlkD